MAEFYFLTLVVVILLSIVMIVAQLKLFSINRTLKAILAQLQDHRRTSEYQMKMLLYELRGDKKSAEQLEGEREADRKRSFETAKKTIKPEVLERLRQKGRLPEE